MVAARCTNSSSPPSKAATDPATNTARGREGERGGQGGENESSARDAVRTPRATR
ncbi:MAG TPA: hypothetical protein VGA87_04725 [Pyrinomonadaceae bacterium]